MNRAIGYFLVLGSFALLAGATDAPAKPEVAQIARDYKHLKRATTRPVEVNPELAELCIGVCSGWSNMLERAPVLTRTRR